MRAAAPYKGGYGGRCWTADGRNTKDVSSNRGNWRSMSRESADKEDGQRRSSVEVVENGGNRNEPVLESRLARKVIAVSNVIDCNTRLERVPDLVDNPKMAGSYGLDNLNLNSSQKQVNDNANLGFSLGNVNVGSHGSTSPMSPTKPTGFTSLLLSGSGVVVNTDASSQPNEAAIRPGSFSGDPIQDYSVRSNLHNNCEVNAQQCVFRAQDPQFNDKNPNLTSKWKRRARNQYRNNSLGTGGPILGKQKEVGGTGSIPDVQKKQRNQLVHNLDGWDPADVYAWSISFLNEWRVTCNGDSDVPARSIAMVPKWKPPLQGFWKFNSDAASCFKDRLIGLGVICRDSVGRVKLAAARNMVATVSPLVAETLAIKFGIQFACDSVRMASFPSCLNPTPFRL
ncbi:hypothetical protein LWI29_026994 [Acer saccharum]|uniref:RNase H type-1 domain-containing protein n=1 Tax=Acer saccharum TaxID=4024 RepID=A0AA39RT92_ACESA|nr:hypothetical protein LWI29_026994 [Acer saccharum]